ncbi:MAG: DegV family protein [Tissierellia bacterium]|nr:DegV family protein [Tissierellia bacterium]
MDKIAILTDTGADMDRSLSEKFGIYLISFYMNIEGNFTKEIDIKPDEFYKELKTMEKFPKTSIPSPGELMDMFEKIKKDGYDKLLIVTISNKLSGFNNLCNSLKDYDGLDIKIVDTKNIALAAGMVAIYASELVKQGLNFDKIYEKIEKLKKKSQVFFTIDTLKYLKAGGRIGRVSGSIAEILSIKPIISCDTEEGVYYVVKKCRGEKKLMKSFIETVKEKIEGTKKYYLAISHGDNHEGFQKLQEELKDEINNAEKFFHSQINPTLAANTGPGLIGVGVFEID